MPRQTAVDLAERVRIQAERSGAQEAETYLESSTITEVRTVGDLCRVYREFINAA